MAAIPRCVIAAVSGFALGGAASWPWPATCASPPRRPEFGQPEILLGIIPGGGGTQRLARLVGPSRAKELILTGRQVRADEALRIGLVDEVVAHDELHDRALALAAELARARWWPRAWPSGPSTRGLEGTLAAGIALEQELFAEAFATEDARIGVASFLEHGPGKATFIGR